MMEAGEELDEQIAVGVMGWSRADMRLLGHGQRQLPHYSTDIAAAWLVVEKMRSRHYIIDVQDRLTHWDVCFAYYRGGAMRQSIAKAPTPSHAICLAALEALKETP